MTTTFYFSGLKEQSEIKKRFHSLAKQHHPDAGGSLEVIQEINSQYQDAMRGYYREEKGEENVEWWMEQEGLLFDKIMAVLKLEGVEVELIGVWLWMSGNTKPHKDVLKDKEGIAARWSKDKSAWYWRSPEHSYRRKNKPEKSLDGLREQWGGKKVGKKRTLTIGG